MPGLPCFAQAFSRCGGQRLLCFCAGCLLAGLCWMEKLWLWSMGRELWGTGARLGPGAEPRPCIEARGRWTVIPCTAGEFPRLVSSGPELSPGSPWGGCSWWLLVSSAPSSLHPSGLTSSPSAEAAIPGDVTSWFVDMAEIFCFSVFLRHVVVLTVHLQIGPGSMQRPSEARGCSWGWRPSASLQPPDFSASWRRPPFPGQNFSSPSGPI